MKAKIIKPAQFNASQPQNMETVNTLRVMTVKKGEINEVITARFYMGRSANASVVYCCLWVSGVCSGYGTSGDYGYQSAALADAIRSAGIELYGTPYNGGTAKSFRHNGGEEVVDYKQTAHISGCGSTAMTDALTDIARDVLGYRKVKVL